MTSRSEAQSNEDVLTQMRDALNIDHDQECMALNAGIAEIERLRGQRNELARLLRYAAMHSSLAPLMNDSWREDSLAALDGVSK